MEEGCACALPAKFRVTHPPICCVELSWEWFPMHHLPGIFAKRKQKKNRDQSQPPVPKLVRKNASNSFEYTPSPSPSPSSSGETPLVRETRSFDMPPSWEGASLRIDGDSSDVDVMCRSLGLSGPADFEIPSDMWESMKSMSLDDDDDDVAKHPKPGRSDSEKLEEPQLQNVVGAVNELFKGFDAAAKATVFVTTSNRSAESGHSNGIRGDRPPLLMTPAMLLPVFDSGLSTWDVMRSAEPVSEEPMFQGPVRVCSSGNKGDYGAARDNADQDELIEARLGETVPLSGSCSFTTSQDDDSSSSASLSPNGRAKVDSINWQKGELLGQGSFGKVYKAYSSEGFFFAVKEVSLLEQGAQGRQSVQQLEQEIDLLGQFEHENIVRYLGTDKDDSNLYIFLEFVTQGSLVSLYKTFHLQNSQVSAYTRQILFGLKYLHDKRVVHRDIKCANILVAANGTVKLADFGLAKATRLNDLKSCKGSAFWMAPEVVNRRNQGYGLPADIWSLGCTVLEMLTSHVPYHPLEFMTALFQIGNGIPPPVPRLLSRDARDFILRCLEVNPADRPTAADLLHHPFVKRSLPMGSESPLFRGSRWA